MNGEFSTFHFAQPAWLWALLVPALVVLWLRLTVSKETQSRIEQYADASLLPHLLTYLQAGPRAQRRRLALWILLWSLGVLAMAGPRWGYTDLRLFQPQTDLVILLDISRSMEVGDVMPSRLGRARQEIDDLLALEPRLRVGLIAFASVAHVVAPITEDRETLARVLPEISSDLVRLQGSRLLSALDRAERLFLGQPGKGVHGMLLISDGDFAESDLEESIRRLASKGMRLHVLGMGTRAGANVPAPDGAWLESAPGRPVVSRLNEDLLQSLAFAGKGIYRRADYRDDDIRDVLEEVMAQAPMEASEERHVRIWHDRFYWLVGLGLLVLLPWFRRSRAVSVKSPGNGERGTSSS